MKHTFDNFVENLGFVGSSIRVRIPRKIKKKAKKDAFHYWSGSPCYCYFA